MFKPFIEHFERESNQSFSINLQLLFIQFADDEIKIKIGIMSQPVFGIWSVFFSPNGNFH